MTKRTIKQLVLAILFACQCLPNTALAQWHNTWSQELMRQDLDAQHQGWSILLPSTSVSVLSNELTYGDMYEPSSKTLNLTKGADSGLNFDALVNARVSYGGVRWRKDNLALSLGHEWTADARIYVPNEIFQIITTGNGNIEDSLIVINPSVQYLTAHKWSIGGQYVTERLMVGAQLHILQGDESIYMRASRIEIETKEDFFELVFNKDIEVETSGTLDYNSLEDYAFIGNQKVFGGKPFTKNIGLGLSLEAKVLLTDRVSVFGRVDDLGVVKWKNKAVVYTDKSTSQFSGIDIREAYINDEPYALKDTLYGLLDIQRSVESFSGRLRYSVLLGAEVGLSDKMSVTATYRGKENGSNLQSMAEIGGVYKFGDYSQVRLSNAMFGNSFANIGIGYSTKVLDRVGLYVNTYNPWKIGKYYDAKFMHFDMGFWLDLGGR